MSWSLTGKTGWLYVFDRVTGEPIWPIEERPVPKSGDAGRAELADAAVPDQAAEPYITAHVHGGRHQPVPAAGGGRDVHRNVCSRPTTRASSRRISLTDTVHVPTSNGGTLFGGTAAEPRTGAVYVVAHDNPGILRLVHPGEKPAAAGSPRAAGPGRVSAELPGVSRRRPAGYRHRPCRSSTRRPIRPTTSSPARRGSMRQPSAR